MLALHNFTGKKSTKTEIILKNIIVVIISNMKCQTQTNLQKYQEHQHNKI